MAEGLQYEVSNKARVIYEARKTAGITLTLNKLRDAKITPVSKPSCVLVYVTKATVAASTGMDHAKAKLKIGQQQDACRQHHNRTHFADRKF